MGPGNEEWKNGKNGKKEMMEMMEMKGMMEMMERCDRLPRTDISIVPYFHYSIEYQIRNNLKI
jgi:hypothetical protein